MKSAFISPSLVVNAADDSLVVGVALWQLETRLSSTRVDLLIPLIGARPLDAAASG